jgi:membrane-associated phospholipid phosphatase
MRVRWLSPFPFVVYGAYQIARGTLRWEHAALLVLVPLLANIPRALPLYRGLYPMALLGLVYDGMRYVRTVGITAERVHLCDLRRLEAQLFGWHGATVHDWLQPHAVLGLDLLAAVPYGTFLFVEIGFAVWLFTRSSEVLVRFGWSFFAMNALAFITHHAYPAAPPWYFHAHGCTIDLATRANAAPNLLRVDAYLGTTFFHSLYARSSDIFGAMPSMHAAYPALIVIEGWRVLRTPGRIIAVAWAVLMAFAAVYTDHHWVIDVVAGVLYAAAASRLVKLVFALLARGMPESGTSRAPVDGSVDT